MRTGSALLIHMRRDHIASLPIVTHIVLGDPGSQSVLRETTTHSAGSGPDHLTVVTSHVAETVSPDTGHRKQIYLVPEPSIHGSLPVSGSGSSSRITQIHES